MSDNAARRIQETITLKTVSNGDKQAGSPGHSIVINSGTKQTIVTEQETVDLTGTQQRINFTRPASYQFQHKRNYFTNGSFITTNGAGYQSGGYSGAAFNQQYSCNLPAQQYTQSSSSQINMNVIVVSKEEIEAPWRAECEYLQSVIQELEQHTKVEVVKEVVKEYVQVENTERITLLEGEQNRLREQLLALQRENNLLKDQLDSRGKDLEAKIREIDMLKQRLMDADQRYSTLNGEFSRLRSQLDDKSQLNSELERLRSQLDDRNGEITRLRAQIDERNQTISKNQQRISDLDLEGQSLKLDIERLNGLLRDRQSEIANLKIEIDKLRAQLNDSSRFKDFEVQVMEHKGEINKLNEVLRSRNSDLDNHKSQLSSLELELQRKQNELQARIRDLESTILVMQSEIDRLNGYLRTKNDEIDQWRIRYEDLESQGVTVIQEKVTYLTQEVEVWKERFIKVNHDFNKTQEDLIMAQAELESIKKGGKKEMVVTSRTVRTHNSTVRNSGVGDGGQLSESVSYTSGGAGHTSGGAGHATATYGSSSSHTSGGTTGYTSSQQPGSSQYLTTTYRSEQARKSGQPE